jgi:hypothetical protein
MMKERQQEFERQATAIASSAFRKGESQIEWEILTAITKAYIDGHLDAEAAQIPNENATCPPAGKTS